MTESKSAQVTIAAGQLGPMGIYLPEGAVSVGDMVTDYFPHPEHTWTYRYPSGATRRDIWDFFGEDLRNRGWEVRFSPVGWTYEGRIKQWAMGSEKVALSMLASDTFDITRWRTDYDQ